MKLKWLIFSCFGKESIFASPKVNFAKSLGLPNWIRLMMSFIKRLIYQGPSLSLALRVLRFNSPQGKHWWNDLGKFSQTVFKTVIWNSTGFVAIAFEMPIKNALICSNPRNRISLLLMTLKAKLLVACSVCFATHSTTLQISKLTKLNPS